MTQSLGFLDAAAMKQAIDRDGRVALSVNFDIDKATLRPDAKPVIAEIHALLDANPSLELSIEGHTDNTGDAARNRSLSADRRSEEHTSELQSLMRISYAVFCWKKKTASNTLDNDRIKINERKRITR